MEKAIIGKEHCFQVCRLHSFVARVRMQQPEIKLSIIQPWQIVKHAALIFRFKLAADYGIVTKKKVIIGRRFEQGRHFLFSWVFATGELWCLVKTWRLTWSRLYAVDRHKLHCTRFCKVSQLVDGEPVNCNHQTRQEWLTTSLEDTDNNAHVFASWGIVIRSLVERVESMRFCECFLSVF